MIFLLWKECISNGIILSTVTPGTGTYTGGERGLASHWGCVDAWLLDHIQDKFEGLVKWDCRLVILH